MLQYQRLLTTCFAPILLAFLLVCRATQDDDNDWDWDDGSAGDFEFTSKKREDVSVSRQEEGRSVIPPPRRPKTPPYQKKRLTQRVGSGSRDSSPVEEGDVTSLNSHSSSSHKPIPSAVQRLPSPKASPFSQPKKTIASTLASPPAPPKPKEDDFFAEMGFSAKPTFSAAPKRSTPAVQSASTAAAATGGPSRWQQVTTTSKPLQPKQPHQQHGLGAKPLPLDDDDDMGGGAEWDDDADLDDLLDD